MERKQIFFRCLAEHGIEANEDWYEKTDMSVDTEEEAKRLLDRNPDVQAIFCINDPVAAALYQEMKRRDLEPGKDILVFGFDNTHGSSSMIPPLASIGPSNGSLGKKAMELLIQKLNGKRVKSAVLTTRLYGRASCPYEWFQYEAKDLIGAGKEFIDKYFDDCFYRYVNEYSGEGTDFRAMFHKIMSRIFKTLEEGTMTRQEFEKLDKLIGEFFDGGIMDYTDSTKLLQSLEKLQTNMNIVQQSPTANVWINRLFITIKDCAIHTLSGQKSKRNKWIKIGRENMLGFLI